MKKSKATSRKTGIRDSIMRHFQTYSLWDILFFLSSIAFLLFWVMVHALAALAGYPYLFNAFCGKLVLAAGIGALVYWAIVYLPRRGKALATVSGGILIAIFAVTLLIPLNLIIDSVFRMAEPAKYFTMEYADELLLRQLIENSRFLGHGTPVPDVVTAYATSASVDFFFWEDHLLIMSAYTYGFWMVPVLFVIVGVWCVSAIPIYLRIYSRWYEWVFFICCIAVLYQMIPPLLFATGVLAEKTYLYEAFYAYYSIDSILFALINPLAAMLAVIKRNHDAL